MPGIVLFALTNWAILAGLYFLFAGQVSSTELIAGTPVTIAAAGFAVLLHRTGSRCLRLRAPWLHVVGQTLGALYPDAVRVGRVLLQAVLHRPDGPLGMVTLQPFRVGGHGAVDAGCRAVVTLGSSLAPNGYVLRVLDGEDALAMHRLAPAAPDRDRKRPARRPGCWQRWRWCRRWPFPPSPPAVGARPGG